MLMRVDKRSNIKNLIIYNADEGYKKITGIFSNIINM